MSEYKVFRPDEEVEYALKIERVTEDVEIGSPEDVAKFLRKYKGLPREVVVVLHLDSNFHVRLVQQAAIGSRQACSFDTSDIFRTAICERSDAIILAHNHPQELNLKPTDEDINVTRRLFSVGREAKMPLVDHVLLGEPGFFSFRKNGTIFSQAQIYSMNIEAHNVRRKSKDSLLRMIGKVNRDFVIR